MKALNTALVTGGAGYVGSFAVRALLARGEKVVVLDDLSRGHRDAVPTSVPLVVADLRDRAATERALAPHAFDVVLHFAAYASVGESVADPRRYWENNVGGTLNLLALMLDRGVKRIVFSSTCAVYGEPGLEFLTEDLPHAPVNPYGRSKAVVEAVLRDYDAAFGLRSFRLRYFNAAGSDAQGSAGEDHAPETHLIPLAIGAARTGTPLQVFGTDWPTPDGTCVRDYVHVEDLADAHVAAVDRLRAGHAGDALNLGTGRGTSVRSVISAVERVGGRKVPWQAAPRRPGDPPYLVAGPGRAESVLGWRPRYTSIDDVVRTAWAWHVRRWPKA
jgi:UDP-arabinose 4-epimerase